MDARNICDEWMSDVRVVVTTRESGSAGRNTLFALLTSGERLTPSTDISAVWSLLDEQGDNE